ncbi:MAG: hypothetical protein PHS67_05420 [Sphaerochaetaceae bacterium]|jgi:hypothetical protein|nr:hypothetical protein [Sphaerochaetaceae bacterium]MDD3366680.1 hypothetical protein [Sphaerochaetaceae bacterium]
MKRFLVLVITICITLLMYSCGKLQEKTIKVTDVKVTGKVYDPNNNELKGSTADYLKLRDGTYIMKVNGNKIDMEVEYELIKEFDSNGALYNHNWWMNYVAPLDKAGKPLTAIISNGFALLGEEAEKVNQLLKGKIGDRVKVNLVWGGWPADVGIGKQLETDGPKVIQTILKETSGLAVVDYHIVGNPVQSAAGSTVKETDPKEQNQSAQKVTPAKPQNQPVNKETKPAEVGMSLEKARSSVVGRYTPRNLGYSMEDMYQKTDYLDLNSNGTFTSYMELGEQKPNRGQNYVSGTYKVKSVNGNTINLDVTYIESEVYTRYKTWSVTGKNLQWSIGTSGGTYKRD